MDPKTSRLFFFKFFANLYVKKLKKIATDAWIVPAKNGYICCWY